MDKLIIARVEQDAPADRLLTLHLKEGVPYRIHLGAREEAGPAVGDIYRARVQNVSQGLKNAFLELGEGQRAYMNLNEETENLRPGQEITVLIHQEGVGEKLPAASPELSFPGEWLVLTSDPGFLGFSRRAGFDGPAREAIHQRLEPYFSDCGFIVRTAAEQVPLDRIGEEAARLAGEYRAFMQKAAHSPAPLRLLKGPPCYLEWLQGFNKDEVEVISDDAAVFAALQHYYTSCGFPADKLHFYQDAQLSLQALYNMDKALGEAKNKKVWLKSGAYLVIETTEAMTVIDVNSGKNENVSNHAAERINQEAAREVARQLVLRNMSGMILVDFINMKRPEANEELLGLLRALVREDAILTQVVDMTPLGLVEITRRRIRRPVSK